MFFNESLYLEDEDLDVSTEETMSDDEIKEAADSSFEEPVKDEVDVVEESYEFMLESQEQYYNLREKMMKIEHIAIMKNQNGLVSEAAAMLNEADNGFISKVKGLLGKIKEAIIKLWHRVMGFFKNIAEKIKEAAKKATGSAQIDGKEVTTFKVDGAKAISTLMNGAKSALKFLKEYNDVLEEVVKVDAKENSKGTAKLDNLKSVFEKADLKFDEAVKIQEKIKNYKADTLKKETLPLTKSLIQSKMKVVKMYNKAASDITNLKNEAIKIIDFGEKRVAAYTSRTETGKVSTKGIINKTYAASTKAKSIFDTCTIGIINIYEDASKITDAYYAYA